VCSIGGRHIRDSSTWVGPESNRRLLMCCSQQAFAHNIKAALAKYPEDRRKDVVVLFSAHSLPLEIVKYAFPSVFCKPR